MASSTDGVESEDDDMCLILLTLPYDFGEHLRTRRSGRI